MKININFLEKKLGVTIKRNFTCLGLDTATTTGLVILKTDNDYIHVEHLVLTFKTVNHKEVYATMVKTFERFFEPSLNMSIIEQVFIGVNPAGALELCRYGSFAVAECIKKGINYELVGATTVRSKFKIDTKSAGKGNTKIAVGNWIKENLDISFDDNNINDALILALLGLCEGMDFRSQVEIKKAMKNEKINGKKSTHKKDV